jgi:phenylacetate-coenzyme A ligase PaaK-like adenylate-forming protein
MNAWIARNVCYRTALLVRGEPVFRLVRRYEISQWWDVRQLVALQEQSLEALLRYAATHTKHYANAARNAGLEPTKLTAADLPRLPLLTKADLVERAASLMAPTLPGTASWKTTGGSTGVAVRLRKNRTATAAEQAASWRSYRWYGIRPGDRQARFWGTPLTRWASLRFRAIDFVLNRDRFSAFAFRRQDLRQYFERLRVDRPTWVYGYVSMLVQFAAYCLDEGLALDDLGITAVVSTSEVLTAGDRAVIAEAFGAPVYNEYGCGEVGPILYECERGTLHLMAENLFVELLPAPTASCPAACRLIVTDLHNRATPLVRYDIGDRVVPASPCDCGRALPAFSEVFGRAYDFIEAQDGTRFHGEFFMYHLEAARGTGVPIRQAQFVQDELDHIMIRIVPAQDYEANHGRALARSLADKSGGRFRVDAVTTAEIPREGSGKLRVIQSLRKKEPDAGLSTGNQRLGTCTASGRCQPADS